MLLNAVPWNINGIIIGHIREYWGIMENNWTLNRYIYICIYIYICMYIYVMQCNVCMYVCNDVMM